MILRFDVTCPHCGAGTEQTARGLPSEYRTTCMIICVNPECGAEYQILVELGRTQAPKPLRSRVHNGAAV